MNIENNPFQNELPQYRPQLGEAIAAFQMETTHTNNYRGIDFSDIISRLNKGKPGDLISARSDTFPENTPPPVPEAIKTEFENDADYRDLARFFKKDAARKYWVFNERLQNPGKPEATLQDKVVAIENLSDGRTVLYVYDYPGPKDHYYDSKNRNYLRLRLAATLNGDRQEVIYFDDGRPGKTQIGLLDSSVKDDIILDSQRLLIKDTVKQKASLYTGSILDFDIPTTDFISTIENIMINGINNPEFKNLGKELNSPFKIFEFFQDYLSKPEKIIEFLKKYPIVAKLKESMERNFSLFTRGKGSKIKQFIHGLDILKKQVLPEGAPI